MRPRFIKTDKGDELVVVTRQAYNELLSFQDKVLSRERTERDDLDTRIFSGEGVLRVYRKRAGLTQTELAKKAGLSQAYISAIEREKQMPTAEAIAALTTALGLDHLPLPDIRYSLA